MDQRNFIARFAAQGLLYLLAILACGCGGNSARQVTLYCAQDQEFAEQVLGEFSQRSGIRVLPKFDTESDKSVSLYAELVQEKNRPRCDVHWNNEIISTIRLQRLGLLEPYESPSAAPYPPSAKAKDHTWHAFAARARILIVNTQLVKEADRPRSLIDLTDARWKGRAAMAKSQFGTSATQAACLFEVMGPEKARQFYRDLHKNGIHIEPGNKQVAEGVGRGEYAFGVTDTDDAMEEIAAGHPVAIIFPDRERPREERMGTLFIPNTVALIRGDPNPDGGRKLIDYLLSAEVEAKLAETASHQIPLNPQVKAQLPREILRPEQVKVMDVNFEKATDLWDEAQAFLRDEFSR
jgi:iron(III) transport system substrate-binding protein